jgi:tetratricopeptide (TPR) repeat protein
MGANALVCLGGIAMDLGDYQEAERQFEQGLRWYEDIESGGYPWACAYACTRLSEVAVRTQENTKAKYWLKQSLDKLEKAGRGTDRLYYEALLNLSKLYVAEGNLEAAINILSRLALIEYPPQDQFICDLATASLSELQGTLPQEIYIAAIERGKLLDLETVVAHFLAITPD